MKIDSLIDSIAYFSVKSIAAILRVLPWSVALFVGRFGGAVAWCLHKRRAVGYANLKAAFGAEKSGKELRRILFGMYTNFGAGLAETLCIPKLKKEIVLQSNPVINEQRVFQCLDREKGVIFLTGHFGNWEILAQTSQFRGYRTAVLVRSQKWPRLNSLLDHYRGLHDIHVYSRGVMMRNMIRALKDNSCIGIVGDQSGGKEGVYCRFFGRLTSVAEGSVDIGLRTGCAVLPVFIHRESGIKHKVFVYPELQLDPNKDHDQQKQAQIQIFMSNLEEQIRQYPSHWLWAHKRWKFCRTKSILILTDGKAGHQVQSEALAEKIRAVLMESDGRNEVKVQAAEAHFKNSLARRVFQCLYPLMSPWLQGRLHWLKPFLTEESYQQISPVYADIVISCGSTLPGINLAIAKESMGKSLVLMKPPFPYSLKWFNLLVVPSHDAAPELRNIFRTHLTPNLVTPERLQKMANTISSELQLNAAESITGIIVGGNTAKFQFNERQWKSIVRALDAQAHQHNTQLLITTSRRTHPVIEQQTKETFKAHPKCKLLVIANEHNPPNVIYGMLGLANHLIVTEDSISMISEAISSGKAVTVLRVSDTPASSKHAKFIEQLALQGVIRVVDGHDLSGLLSPQNPLKTTQLAEQEEQALKKRLAKAFV